MQNICIVDKPVDAIDIIRRRSTSGDTNDEPFYVCNISDVIEKYFTWMECMPRIRPFFAVKTNDDRNVIKILATLGTGFDCASKCEIAKVMSCGVGPDSIIYANPTKLGSHIEFAAKKNVDLMTVDNKFELLKIRKYFPNARLVLRIRIDAKAFYTLGKKYGCDKDTEAPALIKLAKSMDLNMIGISFHVGSGCMEARAFEQAIEASRKLFNFAETVGYHFNLLDIGGGFPGDNHIDFREFASIINSSIDIHFPSQDVEIIAEPGRFFVESAYTLACRVHSKREIYENGEFKKIMYYINDGCYGSFCEVHFGKIYHPSTLKPASEKLYKSTIWGPTCDVVDKVREDVMLPNLNFNDYIIFENMGAYAIVTATLFNGFPVPNIEYYVERKDWERITKRNEAIETTKEHPMMLNEFANYTKFGVS